MPPKKRKSNLPSKPRSRVHQYLLDSFPLPSNAEDAMCKNGHILLIHLENGSAAKKTIDTVRDVFGCMPTFNQIASLVNKTIKKFKNFSRDGQQLDSVCQELFQFQPASSATAPNPESILSQQELRPQSIATYSESHQFLSVQPVIPPQPELASEIQFTGIPSPSTSSLAAETSEDVGLSSRYFMRADEVTPRKKKLRRRLKYVSEEKMQVKRKYMQTIKELQEKMQSQPHQIRVLKQTLQRKDLSLRVHKETIKTLKREKGLDDQQLQIKRLKEKQKRLREKRKEQSVQKQKLQKEKSDIQRQCEKLRVENATLKQQMSESHQMQLYESLENEKLALEEKVERLTSRVQPSKKDKKTYSADVRMMVYDYIVNEVPTKNVPTLIKKTSDRLGLNIQDVPSRTTVEQMTRELGVIADLQAAEIVMETPELTLAFDATTQEGIHVNSVHFTTKSDCQVIALDQLAGGTAEDYSNHVLSAVDNLAATYSHMYNTDYKETRQNIIQNFTNTMTDRAAVNHATITKLNESFGKELHELNCHLHPLDTIATSCRNALRSVETVKGTLYGSDCMAGNIVLAINKMRYKDGKGDPRGFLTFLQDHGLPNSLIPRYRGNRLHILFNICQQLVVHYDLFVGFLTTSHVSRGRLRDSLRHDLTTQTAVQELCVLAVIGKLLSGPWMGLFYKSAQQQIDHVEGITVVKGVLHEINEACKNPMQLLSASTDFF